MAKTPKVVQNALRPTPVKIAGLVLRPMKMGSYLVLEKLNSPFVSEAVGGPGFAPSAREIARLAYVLTRPSEESEALLENGLDVFDAAVVKFADDIPVTELGAVGEALGARIAQDFSTVIAPQKKSPKGKTEPSPS